MLRRRFDGTEDGNRVGDEAARTFRALDDEIVTRVVHCLGNLNVAVFEGAVDQLTAEHQLKPKSCKLRSGCGRRGDLGAGFGERRNRESGGDWRRDFRNKFGLGRCDGSGKRRSWRRFLWRDGERRVRRRVCDGWRWLLALRNLAAQIEIMDGERAERDADDNGDNELDARFHFVSHGSAGNGNDKQSSPILSDTGFMSA